MVTRNTTQFRFGFSPIPRFNGISGIKQAKIVFFYKCLLFHNFHQTVRVQFLKDRNRATQKTVKDSFKWPTKKETHEWVEITRNGAKKHKFVQNFPRNQSEIAELASLTPTHNAHSLKDKKAAATDPLERKYHAGKCTVEPQNPPTTSSESVRCEEGEEREEAEPLYKKTRKDAESPRWATRYWRSDPTRPESAGESQYSRWTESFNYLIQSKGQFKIIIYILLLSKCYFVFNLLRK